MLLSIEELKDLLKLCKEDAKKIQSGKPKSFFLPKYLEASIIPQYMREQHIHNMECMGQERLRAFEFANDPSKAEEFGLNAKKESQCRITEWAQLAYPKINISEYENKFEQEYLIRMMRGDSQ